MIDIDIIFVSNGSKNKHRNLTKQAIMTAQKTSDCAVYVCDVHPFKYDGVQMHYQSGDFNYNRYLNECAKMGDSEFIGFFNNDVVFHHFWADEIIKGMTDYRLDSASPFCMNTHGKEFKIKNDGLIHIGDEVRKHIAGWALVLKRSFWEQIGGFDEGSQFWCSDNRYQKQLIKHKGVHGLVTSSRVDHLESQTLRDLGGKRKQDFTVGDVRQYNKEFGENIFGWGT